MEVAGERENGRVRGRHARGGVSFSRSRFFLSHYLQAPATQANSKLIYIFLVYVYLGFNTYNS